MLEQWNRVIEGCELLGTDYAGRIVCRKVTVTGAVLIRFHTESAFIQYQEHDRGDLIAPITWTMTDRETAIRLFFQRPYAFHIHAWRKYGQPKLKKPGAIQGAPRVFSAKFGKCGCQCFVKGNDLWMLHRDFFSPIWQPPPGELIGAPQNYYLKKYFNHSHSAKFIYEDNFACIVLRSEAWLHFERLLPLARNKGRNVFIQVILEQLAAAVGLEVQELDVLWAMLFETVYVQVSELIARRAEQTRYVPVLPRTPMASKITCFFFQELQTGTQDVQQEGRGCNGHVL